jgi:outer membrane protein assembly factor BamB
MNYRPLLIGCCLALASCHAIADEWPRWLGPTGDSLWDVKGLVRSFPKAGPKVVWRAEIANGYSGPSVSQGKVYVMDYKISAGELTANPGGRSKLSGQERLRCYDAATGKDLWTYAYDEPLDLSFPNGPRCSPVIDEGVVYGLGAEGHLTAINAETGKLVWEKELKKEYKCESPIWGYAATPLVVGNAIYTLAGGPGSAVVALDKKTGKELWHALETKDIGYAPPVMNRRDGKDELIVWHSEAINGLDPATGKVHWSQPFTTLYGMSIMAPRKVGDAFFIGAMGKKSMLVKPGPDKAEVIWEGEPNESIFPKNGTPIFHDGHLYGCDTDGDFRCVNATTGKRLWTTLDVIGGKKLSSGTFFAARTQDIWVLFNDIGELILAEVSPAGYKELARAKVLDATTLSMGRNVAWAHPAFVGTNVLVRNDRELVCLSLAP